MSLINLQCADLYVQIAPDIGAAITQFYRLDTETGARFDYLRPSTAQAIKEGAISEMASFLMAPWAGRIREGRFTYQGRSIHYPSADPNQPHSMHGFTRDNPWQVVAVQLAQGLESQALAHLRYRHSADTAWPFSFTIDQTIRLSVTGLRIEVSVRNDGQEVMPFGFGHHPFYPCDAHTYVQAEVGLAWVGDHEVMPIALIQHEAQEQLAKGLRVQEQVHDTVFVDWQRQARIIWTKQTSVQEVSQQEESQQVGAEWQGVEQQERSLLMQASCPQDFFVLYTPAKQDWFCAEPFANMTDSFNLRERFERRLIGGQDIAPGETLQSWFSLSPEA